jgi:hypothetical protein
VNDSHNNVVTAPFTIRVRDTFGPYLDCGAYETELSVGDTFVRDMTATDLSGVADWEINDTATFALTIGSLGTLSTATITSKEPMDEGVHGIQITVRDIYDNSFTRSITINVKSEATTYGIPGFPDRVNWSRTCPRLGNDIGCASQNEEAGLRASSFFSPGLHG